MKRFLLSMTIFLFATLSALAQPTLSSVFPGTVPVGAPAQWIEVNGTNLTTAAQLKLNGVVQGLCNGVIDNTGSDGARKLRFCLGSGSFTTPGEKDLVVAIGGVDSNPVKFTVGQAAQISGAVLIFPWYTFHTDKSKDGELNLWYTDKPTFSDTGNTHVRLIFVRKDNVKEEVQINNFNQGARMTFKLSDFAPLGDATGEGYIIAMVTNGADPVNKNVLSGSLVLKYPVGTGQAVGVLKPIVIKALSSSPATCGSTTCDLKFDGVNYERLPGVISFGTFNAIGLAGLVSQRVILRKFPSNLTGTSAAYLSPNNIAFTKFPTHGQFGVIDSSYVRRVRPFATFIEGSVSQFSSAGTVPSWNSRLVAPVESMT